MGVQECRDAIKRELERLQTKSFVTIGVHGNDNSRDGDEMNNAEIGALQEYGNDKIPPRPWLVPGMQSGNAEYVEEVSKVIADGGSIDLALNRVGNIAVGKVKEYMTELMTPRNADSTIKKKGANNPLIDTGQLKNSVHYQITPQKPDEGI